MPRDIKCLDCTCAIGTPMMKQGAEIALQTRTMKMLKESANIFVCTLQQCSLSLLSLSLSLRVNDEDVLHKNIHASWFCHNVAVEYMEQRF